LTFSEVAAEGLGKYGYVRITGVAADLRRAHVLMRGQRPEAGESSNWECACIPLISPEGDERAARYRLLLRLPDARQPEDVADLQDADEITGFVKCTLNRLNPGQELKSLGGFDSSKCWVIEARRASWLKGFGLTGASAVIPVVFVVWRLRKPLGDD
jgi:hypothetical protein